jgi:hypothetical protein
MTPTDWFGNGRYFGRPEIRPRFVRITILTDKK